MECRQVVELLLDQDNDAAISSEALDHLNGCESCKGTAKLLNHAVVALQQSSAQALDTALSRRIMSAVHREAIVLDADSQPAPLRRWIVVGAVMLAGVLALRFSDWMSSLRATFGPSVDIATGIVLGLLLTAYLCMLVASNFDRVSRFFRVRSRY